MIEWRWIRVRGEELDALLLRRYPNLAIGEARKSTQTTFIPGLLDAPRLDRSLPQKWKGAPTVASSNLARVRKRKNSLTGTLLATLKAHRPHTGRSGTALPICTKG